MEFGNISSIFARLDQQTIQPAAFASGKRDLEMQELTVDTETDLPPDDR